MYARIIVIVSAIVFTSSCYIIPSVPVLPSCPTETGHFFDYLECAWPEERSYQQDKGQGNLDIATIITAYCEEEIAEWLPILDRGVKKSTLELREYGMAKLEGERSVSGTTAEEWDSLDMQDDFAAVLAIYIRGPVMAGFWGQTGGCIPLFQSLEEGAFIEMIKKELKEK